MDKFSEGGARGEAAKGVARSRFPARGADQKGAASVVVGAVAEAPDFLLCSLAFTLAFAVWLLCR